MTGHSSVFTIHGTSDKIDRTILFCVNWLCLCLLAVSSLSNPRWASFATIQGILYTARHSNKVHIELIVIGRGAFWRALVLNMNARSPSPEDACSHLWQLQRLWLFVTRLWISRIVAYAVDAFAVREASSVRWAAAAIHWRSRRCMCQHKHAAINNKTRS